MTLKGDSAAPPARLETAARSRSEGAAATVCHQLAATHQHPLAALRGLRFLDRHEQAVFYPWCEVAARAATVASSLRARGVGGGGVVALVFATGIEFFDAFFGVLLAGGVPAPIYPPVRLGRISEYDQRSAAMLQSVGARWLVTETRVARLLGGLGARLPAVERLVLPALPRRASGTTDEATLLASLSRDVAADQLALIQFSSGTTGAPKGVALTHEAVLHQADLLAWQFPEPTAPDQGLADRCGRPDDAEPSPVDGDEGEVSERSDDNDSPKVVPSALSWLPLYHDMGLIGCVLPALQRPADLTLLGPELFVARPALWLRALSRYRATVSPAPNFAYSLCTERIRDEELEGCDLSSWQAALNGAEMVDARTLEAFARRFAHWGLRPEALTPVYGLAEAALAVTFSSLERPYRSQTYGSESLAAGSPEPPRGDEVPLELVSVGSPIPGFALEVRGDDGKVLPERQVGRVWVRGPSLMSCYLGHPEETRRTLRGGWLDTGDLGFVDRIAGRVEPDGPSPDGSAGEELSARAGEPATVAGSGAAELFLTGRSKDVLVLNGRNHSPEPAEAAVAAVAGIRRGCVVAVSTRAPGAASESLWILAELRRVGRPSLDGIAADCQRELLSRLGLSAERIVLFEPGELPRTSSGKLRRQEALRQLLRGELQPTAGRTLKHRVAGRPMVQAARALWHSTRAELAFGSAKKRRVAESAPADGAAEPCIREED
jgi:acyl-CoA synthetase (AMP-forming)/AMP-acid ligase II